MLSRELLKKTSEQEKIQQLNQFLEIKNGFSFFKEYNLSELYHLKIVYNENKNLLKEKLMELSKNSLELNEEAHIYRTTMKFVLEVINEEIKRITDEKRKKQKQNRILNGTRKKIADSTVSFDDDLLDKKEVSLIGKLVNREKVHSCSWDMLISSYQKIIKNYSFIQVEEVVYEGVFKVLESNLKEEEKYSYLISIYDYLNNRKKRLGKNGDKIEKEKIGDILDLIDRNLIILKPEIVTKKDELASQIMDYLLENPVPYYYMRRLFAKEPSFLQMRRDGKHISVSVLKYYIESQKEELRNHKNNYIPKEYYASFFELFFENEVSDINQDDIVMLNQLKDEFVAYLNDHKYKEDSKIEAMNQIEIMLRKNKIQNFPFSDEMKSYLKELKDRNYLLWFDDKKVRLTENYVLKNKRRIDSYRETFYDEVGYYPLDEDLMKSLSMTKVDFQNAVSHHLFVPSSTPYANFSILQNSDGSMDFRIHVLDLTYYVGEDDFLDMELVSHPMFDISKFLKSERVDEMPTITYQFKIHANHSVGPLKIYESIVPVLREKIDYSNYRDDKNAKKIVSIYRKLNNGGEKEITESVLENFFFQLLEEKLCQLSFDNGLPIILKGANDNLEEDMYRIQNGLGNLFSKMEKYTFKTYGSLFDETLDDVHYANELCGNGNFSLSLMHPSNLVDLFNQRLFFKLEKFSRLNASQRQMILEASKIKSDSIVNMANQQLGYIKDVGYQKVKLKEKRW